jgi:hypothetical protein
MLRREWELMKRLAETTAGLAAALALLLAGCGGGPDMNGPFGDSPTADQGAQSFCVAHGAVATFGMLNFSNIGGTARITKVTLVDARHLQTVADWVVRITGNDLIGVFNGYPPLPPKGYGPGRLPPGIHWATRQHADGATIVHTPFPDSINLVLVLRATGAEGSAKSVYVDYESAGTEYRMNLAFAILLWNGVYGGVRCH